MEDRHFGHMFFTGIALSFAMVYFPKSFLNSAWIFLYIIIIAFLYFVPLMRSLEKANGENSNGWWWACLLFWPVIPIYLYNKHLNNE